MSDFIFTIDGVEVDRLGRARRSWKLPTKPGVYIPRLCDHEGLAPPRFSCRVCTVKAGGRSVAACTQPAEPGQAVENETPHLTKMRRDLVEMLFHEGNHLCPICEASGNCELQAMAYRLDMTEATKFPYLEPCRALDASHPDIALDTNRCISCGRCIRASPRTSMAKGIFGYVGRGIHRRVAVNGENLSQTRMRPLSPITPFERGGLPRRLHHPQTGRIRKVPIGEREFDEGLDRPRD